MKLIKRILLLISVLAVLAGLVYTLDWLGVIDAGKTIAKLTGDNPAKIADKSKQAAVKPTAKSTAKSTAKRVTKEASQNSTDSRLETLQKENTQLKATAGNLQKQISALTAEKEALSQKQLSMEQEILNKDTAADSTSTKTDSFKQIAKYYAEMKPQDAVAILKNLDDDTVIGILVNLDSDQTAKILTAMDAKKAAQLINKLSL